MRARPDAKHTKHARAQIVLVTKQLFLLFAIRRGYHFRNHIDRIVRTSHHTQAAADTLMFIIFIMGHNEAPTKTIEHHEFFSIFGILLRYLLCKKLTHGRP